MNKGAAWHAWVDYNGAADTREVRFFSDSTRPTDAHLLCRRPRVGAGLHPRFHRLNFRHRRGGRLPDILSSQFVNTFGSIGNGGTVPAPAFWALMAAGLLPLAMRRREKAA